MRDEPLVDQQEDEMVAVYGFKRYDISRDEHSVLPYKGTAEYIRSIRAEIIPGTTEDVDPSLIDEEGRYGRTAEINNLV